MPAKINLLNQTFGKLTVIEETSKRKNGSVVWKCQCECGNFIECSTTQLRNEGIYQCRECGIDRKPVSQPLRKNWIGETINNIKILDTSDKRSGGKILYKCQCYCGNVFYCNITDLQDGHTKSCGCKKQKYTAHTIINNREILGVSEQQNSPKHLYYKCKCLLCGREYDALAQTIENTISCGCQRSIGEFNIIQILNENNVKYQKEYVFPQTNYRFDFVIFNDNNEIIRLIEFDGEQHYQENVKNSGWNTYEKYEYILKCDTEKNQLAKEKNIPLIRIPYWERDNITYNLLFTDKYKIL